MKQSDITNFDNKQIEASIDILTLTSLIDMEKSQVQSSQWYPDGYFIYDGIPYTSTMCSVSNLSACREIQFRDDDVLIASYPKTGKLLTLVDVREEYKRLGPTSNCFYLISSFP